MPAPKIAGYACVAFLAIIAPAAHAEGNSHLVMGMGSFGSTAYSYMSLLADEIDNSKERSGGSSAIDTRYTGGSMDNLRRIESNQINVSLVTLDSTNYRDPPRGVSILWCIEPFPLVLAVRKDINLGQFEDISRLSLAAGGSGASIERFAPKLFESIGLKPIWRRGSWDQLPYMYTSGQIDGVFAPLATVEAMSMAYGAPEMKLIPLGYDLLDRIVKSSSGMIGHTEIDFRGQTYRTIGMTTALIVRDDVSSDLVRRLYKARHKLESNPNLPRYMRSLPANKIASPFPVHALASQLDVQLRR